MADPINIQGLDAVLARMRDLPKEIQKKGATAALRKGANIVRDAARAGARRLDDPQTATNIAKNIVVQSSARAGKREGGVVMKVGVRGGAKVNKDPSNIGHWRFLELGNENNPARPFMVPALASNVQNVTNTVVAELMPQLDKALAKAAR